MGVWEYESMGVWEYGSMRVWECGINDKPSTVNQKKGDL